MYQILRNFFFLFPPEQVHYFSMNLVQFLCKFDITKRILTRLFHPKTFDKGRWTLNKLQLKNPVGLAAGFDKNAIYLQSLGVLGFGFVEIGTVTPLPQNGSPQPRLFRLQKDKALINRMGFNNDGVEAITERLKNWKKKNEKQNSHLIIGGNIGKNKETPNDLAWKDYEICFLKLHPWVDYFVVNVSSPNTPGLRELQGKEFLQHLLSHLKKLNEQQTLLKPIFLKIAPDLTFEQLDSIIELAQEIKLDGLVVANTTIARESLKTSADQIQKIGLGGLSGLPLKNKNTELVSYIFKKANGQIPIIASGGIFNGTDAKEKMEAGASVIQVWTGFIYEGPSIVKNICATIK
ncbi:MAG: quinone-dependent dihydroorotate dehydrogenase [Chitinophagaceae bacterium]|nr:MAG: quinone-dependent dihydroorotate dehydrogenase [Chitinophagaceae bacterium]